MKKILITAASIVVMLGIMASPVAAQTPVASVTFWADNMNINAGSVDVSVDGDTLTVDIQTIDGWEMTETHLYVGTGAPAKSAPGRFPYKHEDLGGVTADQYNLSLAELGLEPGDTACIAVQAALQKLLLDENGEPVLDEDGDPIYLEESAWAYGDLIRPNKNWAMYFSITIPAAAAPIE